jgi:hypothetical protein
MKGRKETDRQDSDSHLESIDENARMSDRKERTAEETVNVRMLVGFKASTSDPLE